MLSIIIGFGILIFIHEFGHFIVARLCGVKVEKFSIGMGPALVGFKRKDTYYQIGMIPFGGFCQFKEDSLQEDYPLFLTGARFNSFVNMIPNEDDASFFRSMYTTIPAKTISKDEFRKVEEVSDSPDRDTFLSSYTLDSVNNTYVIDDSLSEKDRYVTFEFIKDNQLDYFDYTIVENMTGKERARLSRLVYKFIGIKQLRDKDSFFGITPWKRLVIAFAGPLMNYFLAILFFTVLAVGSHREVLLPNKILLTDDVLKSGEVSPAKKAGLLSGDRVIRIDGHDVGDYQTLSEEMVLSTGKKQIEVEVEREGELLKFAVTPKWDRNNLKPVLGVYYYQRPVLQFTASNELLDKIGFKSGDQIVSLNGRTDTMATFIVDAFFQEHLQLQDTAEIGILRDGKSIVLTVDFAALASLVDDNSFFTLPYLYEESTIAAVSPFNALLKSITESNRNLKITFIGLGSLLLRPKGDVTAQLGGPIKIGYLMMNITNAGFSQGIYEGIRSFLEIVAVISLALAFFNLLPFPALDGWYILLCLFEMITRKTVKMKVVYLLNFIGFVILITFALVIAFFDVRFISMIPHK